MEGMRERERETGCQWRLLIGWEAGLSTWKHDRGGDSSQVKEFAAKGGLQHCLTPPAVLARPQPWARKTWSHDLLPLSTGTLSRAKSCRMKPRTPLSYYSGHGQGGPVVVLVGSGGFQVKKRVAFDSTCFRVSRGGSKEVLCGSSGGCR